MMDKRECFLNPPSLFRPRKIRHKFLDDHEKELDTILAEGYGGIVTNVPAENGFTSNPENIRRLERFLKFIKERGIPYWIYDEDGYPSGKADTLVLDGHPELRSKGMFMYKRYSFEDTVARYHLPDEADKIVYAVKYPFFDTPGRGRVDYSRPTELPFSEDYLECELSCREVLYVFSVKTTHEGTHSMHNANSQRFNINIMDKRAVRRFIDVAYEPIAKIDGAYEGAEAVFTDEPSLFCTYNLPDSSYNYAVCPYADGMFECYYESYGERLEPRLPLIFEGGREAYPLRIKFYNLVGKMVADAYSGQLNEWCRAHGTKFSGHYLGEDEPFAHVIYYGDYTRVLGASGYPGFDILSCFPEIFKYVNDKVPEMVARKMGSGGLMVELCPFDQKAEFDKAPYDNMRCITALCYLHGARVSNSYFQLKGDPSAEEAAKMSLFNAYTARLGYMLEGLTPDTDVFVYYPIENCQARMVPTHSREASATEKAYQHDSLEKILESLELSGINPLLADRADVIAAGESLEFGEAKISGLKVGTLLIPSVEVMDSDALEALKKLAECGVRVRFIDDVPTVNGEGETIDAGFAPLELDRVQAELLAEGGILSDTANGKVIRGKFRDGDGTLYLLVNTAREGTRVRFDSDVDGEIFDPDSGEIKTLGANSSLEIPAMRALFVRV